MEKGLIDMNVFSNINKSGYNVVIHPLTRLHPKSSERHILHATNISSRKAISEVNSLDLH